jgi:hypothetical protein
MVFPFPLFFELYGGNKRKSIRIGLFPRAEEEEKIKRENPLTGKSPFGIIQGR